MIKTIIFLVVILVISGCGMMGSSSKKDDSLSASSQENIANLDINATDDSTQLAVAEDSLEDTAVASTPLDIQKNSILPQTISMDFPEVLKETTSIENNESNQSLEDNQTTKELVGYQLLKEDIAQIEDIIKRIEVNLIILENVMPTVLDRCEGMISCRFPKDELSIAMDNETISNISSILNEDNISLDNLYDKRLSLGEIAFEKYDELEVYQYQLSHDIKTKILFDENNQTTKKIQESQIVKWSEDKNNVLTIYRYENNQTSTDISIHYTKDENNKEMMYIYDMIESNTSKENTSLILANSQDTNDTLTLHSNSIETTTDNNETNTTSFSSNVEISKEKGLLLFSGDINQDNNSSNAEVVCDNNESCETNTTQDEQNDIEMIELTIEGGNLEDGSYILLPPYIDIEQLRTIDIFRLTIGTFTIFDEERQGELHELSYSDIVNELTIVKIMLNRSQESTKMFEIVPQEDKPTLKIVNY